jgi:hypothetical protein
MVLTTLGTGSSVDSYKSIIYTVDQVHLMRKGGSGMTTVIERNEGHYKVHKVPYGKDYVWCPRCVLVECDCGERLVLTPVKGECKCGRDHTTLVREELAVRGSEEGVLVPWRDEYRNWLESKWRRSEHDHWLEWRTIE